MKNTVTVKTEKELIRDYGVHWKNRKFVVHDMDDMNATVYIDPRMIGMSIQLEDHEYEYYQDTGVIRWCDESFTGMYYITNEMMVGTGKYTTSVIVDDIYKAKYEPIMLKTSASYIIHERVIKSRMNLVKLKC